MNEGLHQRSGVGLSYFVQQLLLIDRVYVDR